jgi:hypothetical protein
MNRTTAAGLLGLFAGPALAQPAFPPAPEQYKVELRYRIRGRTTGSCNIGNSSQHSKRPA